MHQARTPAQNRKRKYRSDGTPVWSKRTIDGPGVWVTCVKGRERQAVGELYDLFESLADELWPEIAAPAADDEDDGDLDDVDLEKQVAQEIAKIQRPRRERHFASCQTNTPCLVFIACKPPVDPLKLVIRYIDDVQRTGVTRTKNCHRFTPVSATCVANMPEICGLFQRVIVPYFESATEPFKYKIELRMRNHNTVARPDVIAEIAALVPQDKGHTVSLEDADVFVLVEIFKSVCGMSVVRDYYALQKFNAMEIVQKREGEGVGTDGM